MKGRERTRASPGARVVRIALGGACLLASSPGFALGPQGEPIDTSEYTLDLYEGPTLASSRIVGLGGAYTPIATGVEGMTFNPAAVAVREPWSQGWFDWDLDGGITLPSSISDFDFDNNGDDRFANEAALFLTGGGRLLFGDLGIGLNIDISSYEVRQQGSDQLLTVDVSEALLAAGYSLFDGQVVVGLGLGVNSIAISREEIEVASVTGYSGRVGATFAPTGWPVRAGASVRGALPAGDVTPTGAQPDEDGNFVADGYILPRTVTLPVEFRGGVALQLLRPLNFGWRNPHDEPHSSESLARRRIAAALERRKARKQLDQERPERHNNADERSRTADAEEEQIEEAESARLSYARREDVLRRRQPYRHMPREKLLLIADVRVTLPSDNGVGVESFLRQEVERSGEEVTVTPRLGVESEIVPGYLVVRGGSYYEPTRFRTSSARAHGTGGLDVHIPIESTVFGLYDPGTTFRLGGALDLASRYLGWAISAGIWR